jgi:hypothetical protein
MRLSRRQLGATRLELVLSIAIAIAVGWIIGYLILAERETTAEVRYYADAYANAMKHAGRLMEQNRLSKLTELKSPPATLCEPPLQQTYVRSVTGTYVPACRQVAPAPAQEPAK